MSITVTHKFVSPKTEQTDPTLVGPNEWNAGHVVVDSSVTYKAPDYNFCTTPGGTLTANITNTVTLAPVPLGVNGSDAQHWLFVAGGTGSAETVLITGGTAVSGAASGTITFVPTNNHTGAWQICSATAGIQEAIITAPSNSFIHITAGTYAVYAQTYVPSSKILTIEGDGMATWIAAQPSSVSYNIFYLEGNSGSFLSFGNMRINGPSGATGGYSIYLDNWGPPAIIHDIDISGCYNGMAINGQPSMMNIIINDFTNIAITGLGYRFGGNWFNVQCVNFNVTHASAGVYMDPSTNTIIDGWICVGCMWGGNANATSLDYGVRLNPGTNYASNIEFNDVLIESVGIISFSLEVSAGIGAGIHRFENCRFACNGANSGNGMGIYFTSNAGDASIKITHVVISGCYFSGGQYPIYLGGVANVTITGCTIAGPGIVPSNGSSVGIELSSKSQLPAVFTKNVTITGNVIGYAGYGTDILGGASTDGPLNYAIQIDSASHSNIVITGNILHGTLAPITGVIPPQSLLLNNLGVSDVVPGVASATTLLAPPNPNFNITGTVTISGVTGMWANRTGQIRAINGNIIFIASSTIITPGTMQQNKMYNYYFDGNGLWIMGSGF